ncbi:MAG: hypothetical protein WBB19_11490 [Desulforhopalus sp.]
MVVRVLIAGFASFVAGISYLTGLAKLMTALLLGFGAFSSFFFGVLFLLPIDTERVFFPVYEKAPAWPYFIIGLILTGMAVALFLVKTKPEKGEDVSAVHFKYLLGGFIGYLSSLFLSSFYWFPSDEKKLSADPSTLTVEVLVGTSLFLIGVSVSCYLLYRASKGRSARHPDLMRRFVLGLFTFFQFDKMPLLVAYLLIYSPATQVIFPNIAALALASYIPVGFFLLKTTWDTIEEDATHL